MLTCALTNPTVAEYGEAHLLTSLESNCLFTTCTSVHSRMYTLQTCGRKCHIYSRQSVFLSVFCNIITFAVEELRHNIEIPHMTHLEITQDICLSKRLQMSKYSQLKGLPPVEECSTVFLVVFLLSSGYYLGM